MVNASEFLEEGPGIKINRNIADIIDGEASFAEFPRRQIVLQERTKTPRSAITAEEAAGLAYRRLMRNKEITVPRLENKIIRWLPVKLKMKAVARMKH